MSDKLEWKQDTKHNWRYACMLQSLDMQKPKLIGFVVVITGGFMCHFPSAGRNKTRKFEGIGLPEIGRFLLENWENENV